MFTKTKTFFTNVVDKLKFKGKKGNNNVKVNDNWSKIKSILSKISGAFMLPIAVMAIAGLFLGIGATIKGQAGGNAAALTFGTFIQNLGDPIFGLLPVLFAAAFVISFTNEAGVAVFSSIIGYFVFISIQTPFIWENREISVGNLEVTQVGALDPIKISNVQLAPKLVGYTILFDAPGRGGAASLQIVKPSYGILSLQTSIFGGIIIGMLVAYLYNKFHKIQLPQIISFFGGKRFVPIITVVAVIPVAFLFLIFWPWVGAGLNAFGNALNKVQFGFESLIFGIVERMLIPFGLHHAFYAPLWYSAAGGDAYAELVAFSANQPEIKSAVINEIKSENFFTVQQLLEIMKVAPHKWQGDSYISVSILGLDKNYVAYTVDGKEQVARVFEFMHSQLGIKVGRFMQGKYPFMQFALPAAAAAMVMAAPKENRKVALSAVVPSAVTSFVTGVTEPIEFTFLFLAPYMFFGFHAFMAGLSFMLMNVFGAHIGQTFSGGILDLIIYGIIPVAKGTNFWWWAVIGLFYAPIYYFVFYFVIKKFNLETPGRGSNVKMFTKADYRNKNKEDSEVSSNKKGSLTLKEEKIVVGFGGWDNITNYNNCASRLRYDVKDMSKVDEELLKEAGVVAIKRVGDTHVQAIVGPVAEQLNAKISSHKYEPISFVKSQNSQVEIMQPVAKEEEEVKQTEQKTTEDNISRDPATVGRPKLIKGITYGFVKPLEEIEDGVFSEKMLGDGVIVSVPKNIKTIQIHSPFDGVVQTAFPTGHAYGVVSKEGVSVLIHVGIDTVNLNGKGFTKLVEQGQEVKQGEVLAEIDMEYIRDNAPKSDIVVVVTPESTRTELVRPNYGRINVDEVMFEVK